MNKEAVWISTGTFAIFISNSQNKYFYKIAFLRFSFLIYAGNNEIMISQRTNSFVSNLGLSLSTLWLLTWCGNLLNMVISEKKMCFDNLFCDCRFPQTKLKLSATRLQKLMYELKTGENYIQNQDVSIHFTSIFVVLLINWLSFLKTKTKFKEIDKTVLWETN